MQQTHILCQPEPFFYVLLLPSPSPPNSQSIKKIKKMKENYSYITTLHKLTKNHDHGLYCSSDMVCDGCNCYFSFWAIFCPFTPPNSPKKFHFKKFKKKKYLEISSLNTSVLKIMIICYTVSEIWHVADVFVFVIFHFGKCFALLPH